MRPILIFTEEDLVDSPVCVLPKAQGDEPLGTYRLPGSPPQGELEDLWLDPRVIGRGLGRRLLEHALRTAAELGFDSLLIEGDPNAEGFYLSMGTIRVDDRRLPPTGRPLPLKPGKTRGAG